MVTNSQPLVSRRRFLAIVGASAGAVFLGRHAYAAPGIDASRLGRDGSTDKEGGYEPVVVAEGLIDATVWGGSLLTLRNGPAGYFVRDEQRQRDYNIATPSGAQAYCLAVSGQVLVVGGHRIIESEPVQLKSGELYTKLVSQAGAEAERLSRQSFAPAQPAGFSFRPTSHRPLLLASSDGREWQQIEFSSDPLRGGTVGAILQSEGVVAVLRYIDSGDTDSGVAVEFASLAAALRSEFQKQHQALSVPHGGLWGAFEGPSGGLVIAYGSDGARARSVTGADAFSLPSGRTTAGGPLHERRIRRRGERRRWQSSPQSVRVVRLAYRSCARARRADSPRGLPRSGARQC